MEPSNKIFADLHLARRLEAADAAGEAEFAETHARLFPDLGSTSIKVAGGQAIYTGPDSPLTQAIGLGLHGPVTGEDLDLLEDFYRSRGAAVNIELSPHADPSLLALLNSRNYHPVEFSNVLMRKARLKKSDLPPKTDAHVREPAADEVEVWAQTVVKSFVTDDKISPSLLNLFITFFHMENSVCLMAEIGGEPVGGGGITIQKGIAAIFAAGTIPAHRRQGVQAALIHARLAIAAMKGADLVMVMATPGSTSQKNVERQGFRVVYTRTKMVRQ